jgi:hypothetical protein
LTLMAGRHFWLADDSLIGRQIAIKKFASAGVRHPGVVTLHDVIPATPGDDAMYLLMEFVQAATLAGRHRCPFRAAGRITG